MAGDDQSGFLTRNQIKEELERLPFAKGPTMADELHVPTKFLPDAPSCERYSFYDPEAGADWNLLLFCHYAARKLIAPIDPACLKPGKIDDHIAVLSDALKDAGRSALMSLMTDEAKAKEQEARDAAIWDQVLGMGPRPGIPGKPGEGPPDGPGPETWRDRPPLL